MKKKNTFLLQVQLILREICIAFPPYDILYFLKFPWPTFLFFPHSIHTTRKLIMDSTTYSGPSAALRSFAWHSICETTPNQGDSAFPVIPVVYKLSPRSYHSSRLQLLWAQPITLWNQKLTEGTHVSGVSEQQRKRKVLLIRLELKKLRGKLKSFHCGCLLHALIWDPLCFLLALPILLLF